MIVTNRTPVNSNRGALAFGGHLVLAAALAVASCAVDPDTDSAAPGPGGTTDAAADARTEIPVDSGPVDTGHVHDDGHSHGDAPEAEDTSSADADAADGSGDAANADASDVFTDAPDDGHSHDADADDAHTHDTTPEDTTDAPDIVEGETDLGPYECDQEDWVPGACTAGERRATECTSARHVPEPERISYDESPPSCGDHRNPWGKWGEYEFFPPQRYIHNLEHGGIALLYHQCADESVINALRDYARAREADDGGEFRWVLAPYFGLETTVAVAAWGHLYTSNCVNVPEIEAFVSEWYRSAPEDVASDGRYERFWIGR